MLRKHREKEQAKFLLLGVPVQDSDFVFRRVDGRPYIPNIVTDAFRRIARKAGLPGVRLHDLRHTHASLMLAAGIHPKIVSERLGHSSVTITLDRYSHVLPGLQEAAALRFEEVLARPDETPVTQDVPFPVPFSP